MTPSQVDRIVEFLSAIRERPQMYFEDLDPDRAETFFYGFASALGFLDKPLPGYDQLRRVYARRGFNLNALGVVKDMTSKGLSRETIVNEIVSAHIDAWKEIKDNLAEMDQCAE